MVKVSRKGKFSKKFKKGSRKRFSKRTGLKKKIMKKETFQKKVLKAIHAEVK